MFRTCCKSSDKVCNVIMDSGSTDKLVIEEMVQKLGLKRVRHPYPFLDWLVVGWASFRSEGAMPC